MCEIIINGTCITSTAQRKEVMKNVSPVVGTHITDTVQMEGQACKLHEIMIKYPIDYRMNRYFFLKDPFILDQ